MASMADAGTDEDEDVAIRCRALTHIYAGGNSRLFAEMVGIQYTSWNGTENSGALSRDVARRITRKWPEVSLDWVYRGSDRGLTTAKGNELAAIYQAMAAKFKTPEKPPPKKTRAS